MLWRHQAVLALLLTFVAVPARAQHHQNDFPPEDFRARWAKVFDRLGNDAIAVVQGAPLATGYNLPRQTNTFYYLSGIETPHAYLRLDGRTRRVTLYLPPQNERLERAEGKVLAAEDVEMVKRLAGVDEVLPTTTMTERWPVDEGRVAAIYVEFAPAEGYAESRGELLQAQAVFIVNGARLDAYRPITASGTENINNMHYYRSSRQLKPGDLVLMDYAPDFRYYVSDIARIWPVNGKYSPWQRELLQFVLEYHKVILARVRPGVTPQQILDEAKRDMAPVLAKTRFSKPIYEQAARRLVDTGGGALSHMVGMAVHDVGTYRDGIKPGHVFSIDPQLRVPEENLYLRYEDTIVVTETGIENFTHFLPMELDEMEALVGEAGIVQKLPAGPSADALRTKRSALSARD
jgi:Metallopeptidase family M24/Aminopeptidase P, N-terminal domain